MKRNSIFFFGALPHDDESKTGGGEWGNLRTVNMLKGFGYNVYVIRKTNARAERSHVFKYSTVPFRLTVDIFKVVSKLLFGDRKSLFHYSGFAWKTIFLEYIIIRIVKMMGYRYVYEIRGGGLLSSYDYGNSVYKKELIYILNNAACVFSQGAENIPLIKTICKTPVFHYANCVDDNFYPHSLDVKDKDKINLIYFGRINPDKNILFIVETAAILHKRLPNVTLTIIGNGQDVNYVKLVKERMEHSLPKESYGIYKGCPHDELKKMLRDKHFYIFPSEVVVEGQSNALTEAISFGIVPIASPQGFNRSVVGDDNLIVKDLDANQYAKTIFDIVSQGRYTYYSQKVYNHFLNNFTREIVFSKTQKVYDKIFDS